MSTDKAKDDKYFNCGEEHEFKYLSGLYNKNNEVYDFLKAKCKSDEIKYSTHEEVYIMIKNKLGYSKK